ncbi:hypothetical protein BC962_2227 [Gillisia mitskevichiae]|uniref:Uncharacterized protein n=1 Tax=Gillisia mitskevichiae TaxID=270921 RepID=A0A495PKG7_9FLAO|nr:hypothetical protein [Gillisia mitskevichiae]RKS50466.1 hypothetical protein BC962_2227 [Gillisia mitskevichiae]
MTKFLTFILLAIFGITSSNAQRDPFNPSNSSMQVQTKKSVESEIVGSPYFEEMFTPGIIEEVGGNQQNAYFRYNVKDDQVEVKVSPSQSDIYILPRQQKFIYQLKDYSYVLGSYNVEGVGLVKGFVNKYHQSDKVTFIGKPFVTITQAQAAKTGYQKATPASLNVGINYYFGLGDNKLQEIKLREKDFKNILPSSKEMKQYFSDNKIKDINDVKKMIDFYESLGS